jgi:hypothetical protein
MFEVCRRRKGVERIGGMGVLHLSCRQECTLCPPPQYSMHFFFGNVDNIVKNTYDELYE